MKNIKSILWGVLIVTVGIVIGLNTWGITDIDIFFDGWWTLFIIIPCFAGLFKKEGRLGHFIGLLIGIFLLLSCQEMIDSSMFLKLLWPSILIIIGLSIIYKNLIGDSVSKKVKEINKKNKDQKEYVATFSGQKIDFEKDNFEGADVTAVFGGVDLLLKESIIKKDVVINVSTTFGGVDIYVPDNVNVKINSNSIFGGVKCKKKNEEKNKVTIYINATCLFGGVDIK